MVCTALSSDMAESETFNYEGYPPHPTIVKVEPDLGLSLLHSPPSSSRSSSSARHSSSASRLRRKVSSRSELSVMTHPYGNWSSSSLKNEQGHGSRSYSGGAQSIASSRRGGNGDQSTFAYPDSYAQSVCSFAVVLLLKNLTVTGTSIAAEVQDTPIQEHLLQRRAFRVPWETLACIHTLLPTRPHPAWHGRRHQPLPCQATTFSWLVRPTSLLISQRPTHP